jgi:hypothetical protein
MKPDPILEQGAIHVTQKFSVVGSADQWPWKHADDVLQIGPCVLQKSIHSP